jgi:hypothetical protein
MQCLPSAMRHNSQCQPVRKWTPDRHAIGHTPVCFKPAGEESNRIPECKIVFKPDHHAPSINTRPPATSTNRKSAASTVLFPPPVRPVIPTLNPPVTLKLQERSTSGSSGPSVHSAACDRVHGQCLLQRVERPFSVQTQFTLPTVKTREKCHRSHACKSFKRAGVETNGILECKSLSKTRTVRYLKFTFSKTTAPFEGQPGGGPKPVYGGASGSSLVYSACSIVTQSM